jgi:DNA-binding GntR family transcriptional regulator
LSGYAISLMLSNPDMMFFMNREAGTMILMKLVQDVDKGLDATPRRLFFADIAERFGVSRTHVRITLQDAQEAGLVRMTEESIALMPPIVAAFERFVADTMAGHDIMFRAAMRELAG